MDKTYASLITFLHNSSSSLSVQTAQSVTSHYLAHLQPSPTPLSAAFSSSQFASDNLTDASSTFRNAVHIKHHELSKSPGNFFSSSVSARCLRWTTAVISGLKGSPMLVHLACSVGLLLGLHDIASDESSKSVAQDDVLIVLAECVETYDAKNHGADLAVALILGAQGAILASDLKFRVLPLSQIVRLLTSVISSAFHGGDLPFSVANTRTGVKFLPQNVRDTSQSQTMKAMGSMSKFCARGLSTLLDSNPEAGVKEAANTLSTFLSIAANISRSWNDSGLSQSNLTQMSTEMEELNASVWSILKTLLFSFIMISGDCLSAVVYLSSTRFTSPSPQSVALVSLRVLFYISFVVSHFGGVATNGQSTEAGFPQMQNMFYLALDILSSDASLSQSFVTELCDDLELNSNLPVTIHFSRIAYVLACIEQLTSTLTESFIQTRVLPLCQPHLYDHGHREVYESAHSVILAIFTTQVAKVDKKEAGSHSGDIANLVQQFVPFYAQCLLENSEDDCLSLLQLRLAYASLVRFACSVNDGDYLLARFCIDRLVSLIHSLPSTSPRAQRLQLTLISCVSALRLPILPGVLDEIHSIIVSLDDSTSTIQPREELVQALFDEIYEAVGYNEKEFVMKWWYEHRDTLSTCFGSAPSVSMITEATKRP